MGAGNKQGHIEKVHIRALTESGLKLSREHCQFLGSKITFQRDRLSAAGLKPDKNTLWTVINMPGASRKREIRRPDVWLTATQNLCWK